jgi:hypothetical protein
VAKVGGHRVVKLRLEGPGRVAFVQLVCKREPEGWAVAAAAVAPAAAPPAAR